MEAWGHDIIEFGETEAENLVGLDIVACQIAEGGAMGYHGGVFLVSSTGEVYYTCLLQPSAFTGFSKFTSRKVLSKILPALDEFHPGLMGHGVTTPSGFVHKYLGMGNHLLIKNCIYEEFDKLEDKRMKEHPDKILYNLWLDVVLDILSKNKHHREYRIRKLAVLLQKKKKI